LNLYNKGTDALEECNVCDIAGASILSLELIPLTLYKPHGLSLVLWIWSGDSGVIGCVECPWKALYDPRRSHDLKCVRAIDIVSRAKSLNVDMLFLHGGEPLLKQWTQCIPRVLSKSLPGLGAKVRAEVLRGVDVKGLGLDAMLLEVSVKNLAEGYKESIADLLKKALERDIYLEVILTDLRSHEDLRIEEILKILSEIPEICSACAGKIIPIGIYATHLDDKSILMLRKHVEKICRSGVCYIIESMGSIYPDYVRCPYCKSIAAIRRGGVIVPIHGDKAECPSCGARIFHHKPGRIKRHTQVFSEIYI
jgi:DNA-directed RNA polymerase subunit RPC12/RpoP/organic radical activating enzyme